jgi:hypothetical protein
MKCERCGYQIFHISAWKRVQSFYCARCGLVHQLQRAEFGVSREESSASLQDSTKQSNPRRNCFSQMPENLS